METPLISVVIPVYNVQAYLEKCVDSVLNQTYRNLEVILVDDGSPDNSPAICDSYAKKDSRVRVIHQENKGVGAARNVGVAQASGDWIAFVDSDDWIEPTMYEEMLDSALRQGSDMVICSGISEYGGGEHKPYNSAEYVNREELMSNVLKNNHGPSIVCILYASKILKFVKQLDNCTSEDYAIIPVYVWKAKKISVVDVPFYHYNRDNSSSITHGIESPKPSYAHFVGDRIRANYAKILKSGEDIIKKFERMACRACVRAYVGNLVKQELNYLKSNILRVLRVRKLYM